MDGTTLPPSRRSSTPSSSNQPQPRQQRQRQPRNDDGTTIPSPSSTPRGRSDEQRRRRRAPLRDDDGERRRRRHQQQQKQQQQTTSSHQSKQQRSNNKKEEAQAKNNDDDTSTKIEDTSNNDETRTTTKKKMYGLYTSDYNGDDEDDAIDVLEELYGKTASKAINSVGELIADVAEGNFWKETTMVSPPSSSSSSSSPRNGRGGSTSEQQGKTAGRANRTSTSNVNNNGKDKHPTTDQQKQQSPTPPNKKRQRRYWRDRLTERVDYAFGLHEDNVDDYYAKWQNKKDTKSSRERADDPMSIFEGRQKTKGLVAPFWEEEGSLMSLFFGGRTMTITGWKDGTGRRQKFMAFRDRFKNDLQRQNNIGTTICTTTFRTTLALLASASRWATCKGALPQPIVVCILSAAALSAPRRRRWMALGVTLLALRTVAELIHGYVYGNKDWEDDELYTDGDEDSGCDDDDA